jgi:polysaccharide biosynthesis/export protein
MDGTCAAPGPLGRALARVTRTGVEVRSSMDLATVIDCARVRNLALALRVWMIATALLVTIGNAQAQSGLTADELRELQRLSPQERLELLERYRASGMDVSAAEESTEAPAPLPVVDDRRTPQAMNEGAPAAPAPAPASASDEPQRFGRNLFAMSPSTFQPSAYGPVPDDYELGPGDELVVEVWGEVSFRDRYLVGREGTVLLRDAGRVNIVGLTLREAETEITRRLSRVLSGVKPDGGGTTHVDVTLGKLRAIRVFVIGEATRPGGYEVSSAATVFQALYAAGGPNAIGSMRTIQLVRNNQVIAELDLYEYLTQGIRRGDVVLQDGDTVFIPVAPRTVTVRGEVRRPAIYELLDGEGLRAAIGYAGGLTARARTDQAHVQRVLPPTQRAGAEVTRVDLDVPLDLLFDGSAPELALFDQDDVRLLPVNPRAESFVQSGGAVVSPGRYGWREGMRVSDLVERSGGLWRDALPDRALLVRIKDDYTRESLQLDLSGLASGSADDLALSPMDSLHVYSTRILADERRVSIRGDVRRPGTRPYLEGMTLRDLVLDAGGTLESADVSVGEVSRLDPTNPVEGKIIARTIEVELGVDGSSSTAANFALENHDQVFVRRQPSWEPPRNVVVGGEVMFPGTYALLTRDERLSSVIARAGGLLPTAYVAGFRLYRAFQDAGNIGLDFRHALENPGGTNDLILVEGDEITIPALPNSVKVMGEVGFPTSVVYEKGRSIGDYVNLAGGYARHADKSRTAVVYPSGISRKVRRWWRDPGVVPGSTIVVPREDPEDGVDWGDVVVSTTQVLASLATIILVIDRTGN